MRPPSLLVFSFWWPPRCAAASYPRELKLWLHAPVHGARRHDENVSGSVFAVPIPALDSLKASAHLNGPFQG